MVTLDELAALDAVLWQRNGKLASQALRCNQSTVSRRLTRTLDSFQLTMTRRHGEWQVLGNPLLLQMERELHQLCRLLGSHPLRLEFSPYCGPMLARCLSKDWVVGTMDHLGQARPLALLEERVIDAYLTESSLDLPAPEDPTWTVIPLWRYPVALVAHLDHPLAGVTGLSLQDLLRFPVPPLPASGFPVVSEVLRGIGLPIAGAEAPPPQRYDSSDWEGLTADQSTLSYATPFMRQIHPALRALESAPLLTNGGALICRCDVAAHGVIAHLVADLRTQLARLAPSLPGLELVP